MVDNNRERPWYKNPYIIIPAAVAIIVAIIGLFTIDREPPDFSISINPMQGEVELGGTIQTEITVKSINGYEHNVSLSASEQPANMIVTFVLPIGGPKPAYTSTMMINVAPNVPADRYSIIVKGTGADGKEHVCTYSLLAIEPEEPVEEAEEPKRPDWREPPPDVNISYPSGGDRVIVQQVIRGTSFNIPEDQVIWIVIYPQEVVRYYPQDNPADIQANGDWTSSSYIGIAADAGKTFDIIAVLANMEAQDVFNDYLEECKEQQSWPGLERLPEGAVLYERINLIRQ